LLVLIAITTRQPLRVYKNIYSKIRNMQQTKEAIMRGRELEGLTHMGVVFHMSLISTVFMEVVLKTD